MEHIIEHDTTPSMPLKTSEIIAHYAKFLPSAQTMDENTLYIPIDTTCWRQIEEKIAIRSVKSGFTAEGFLISPMTGNDSLLAISPKDKQPHEHLDITMPLTYRITNMFAEVAFHKAMTLRGKVLLTATVPENAFFKEASFFTETWSVRGKDYRVSTPPPEVDRIAGVLLSDEVSAFASARGIRAYLADTINTIRRIFTNVSALQIRYEHDSETEQDWLSLNLTISGEIDQILEQYDSYVMQYNRLVPWPTRSLIRLNYDIA